jgi:hypothetical protein
MAVIRAACIVFVVLVSMCAGAQSFVQDRFVIGLWVDPPVEETTNARYRELAEAGFSVVIGHHPRETKDIERQLGYCKRQGLKLIASRPPREEERWARHPALWGYTLRDEPSAVDFPALAAQADALRARYRERLPYINLFPTYATPEQLGTESYEEHVRQFMEVYRPEVLSMDHYPMMTPEEDTRAAYLENLAVMRRHSLAAGVPFWNFFNIMPFGPHDDPTEAQVRWQINASLCYGAKGVLYFCYWTPPGDIFAKGGAILRADGTRTRHYAEAQRINAGLQNLGPTLMQLKSTGVLRLERGANHAETLAGSPIKSITKGNYLIGLFRHSAGGRAVMLMNHDYGHSAWPTVAFDTEDVREVSAGNGGIARVQDDSPAKPGLQISLDSGGARLFLLGGAVE